jgi:hypothetical protein
MTEDELTGKIYSYYDKIKQPKYVIKDWIISDDNLYLKYKNKLTFTNINFISLYTKDCLAVGETKKEYYAIKYNGNFVCIRRSETEYGLVTGEYDLLAINKRVLKDLSTPSIPKFKDICKLFSWKLTKKAKNDLDYL